MASEPYWVQKKKHPLHKKAGARWKKCRFPPRKSWKITYMITLEKAVHTICWIFLQPFIQYYSSKTASKSWQYHTLMVLQSSAKSCTPSKPRVNIVSSSVMNIWPFVTIGKKVTAFCHIGKKGHKVPDRTVWNPPQHRECQKSRERQLQFRVNH